MPRRTKNANLVAARAKMYRDLIFDSAERVFADKGYDGTTMQDIAAEAGISLKTLYATFEGKLEIYQEIGRIRGHQFVEHAAAAFSDGGTTLDIVRRGVRAYVDFVLTHREFFRIQLREGRAWGLSPNPDSTADWQAGIKLQAELLRQGMAEGVFHDGDPELTAATVIAIMQVQIAGLVNGRPELDAAAIADEIFQQIGRYLLKPEATMTARLAATA